MGTDRQYWPALDGLRAVAVVAVIAFHLDIGVASGGFLGVDLFFVISGFLITSLLLEERSATGEIRLGAFWSRRIRRLVPAAAVMIVTTVVASRIWLVPERWASIRGDAVASLAWVANWRFIHDGDGYFESGLGPSPLEHTWSLAVEEQFYVLWPFVMLGLLLLWWARPGRAAAVLGVAAIASAIWMAVLYDPFDPNRAYQGTDTRAQQLLVGAAVAWAVVRWPRLGSRRTFRRLRIPVWIAGALLVTAMVSVDGGSEWLYRGGFLGLSLLSVVVVLAAARPRGGPVAFLAWAPLVAVGRRSYGLYIWHWPVIVFVGPAMGLELSRWPLVALQLLVIVALTEVSFRYVETPARRPRRPRLTIAGWATSAAAVAAVALVVLVPPAGRSLPSYSTLDAADLPAVDAATGDLATGDAARVDLATGDAATGDLATGDAATGDLATGDAARVGAAAADAPPGGFGASDAAAAASSPGGGGDVGIDGMPAAAAGVTARVAGSASVEAPPAARPTRVLVFGDSMAAVLRDGYWPEDHPGWIASAVAELGCGFVPGRYLDAGSSKAHPGPKPECALWRDEWSTAVERFRPDVAVVMIGAWEVLDHRIDGVDVRFPSPEWTEAVRTAIVEGVDIVSGEGRRVLLMRLPCMESNSIGTSARNDRERVAAFNDIVEQVALDFEGVETAPLDRFLCPDGVALRDFQGDEMRFDGVHLTPAGAAHYWDWLFDHLR